MLRLALISFCLLTVLSPFTASTSLAQSSDMPEEFDTGNDYFPIHVYLRMAQVGAGSVVCFPGESLTGEYFLRRPDGGSSWMDEFEDRGLNSFTVDWIGTGNAQELYNEDYIRALKAQVEGTYFVLRGAVARLTIAHAEAAAMLIKGRSFGGYLSRTAVLIDPIGPQYSQPLEPLSFAEARAELEHRDDEIWREMGFGPRAGKFDTSRDIDKATAELVFGSYDRTGMQIRPALLQPMISPVRVEGTGELVDWPVLVIRTPAADATQIQREEALRSWLEAAGARVDFLDLSTEPDFASTTGLPWIGTQSTALLDHIMGWNARAVLLSPTPEMPTPGGS